MGTLSFDLICNRAGGGGEDARAAGPGAPSRYRPHREQPRVRASKRGLDPPPHPARAVPTRRRHWSFREKGRVRDESQNSKLRGKLPDADSSVSHFVRCTYYKSAREHARPVVSYSTLPSEAFVGAVKSVQLLRSLIDWRDASSQQPTPVPRLTTNHPRAGANTMRRRSRVLRPSVPLSPRADDPERSSRLWRRAPGRVGGF